MPIRSRDFLETSEGLVFAVLVDETEEGRSLCFLRYIRNGDGLRKVETKEANGLLAARFPHYLFHSKRRDASLHGVPEDRVSVHHQPSNRLTEIITKKTPDLLENKLAFVCKLLTEGGLLVSDLGVTGSLLIGAQNPRSDIDVVIYGRNQFIVLRRTLERAIHQGTLDPLTKAQWKDSYERRGCSLSLNEYIWHEKRKYNKALISGTKIDFGLVSEAGYDTEQSYRKTGFQQVTAEVTDDQHAFDHPSIYRIRHHEIEEICCFTPTFTGQARVGETVLAEGIVEESVSGTRRLVIGSSREAPGEYIKVLRSTA
ncbi:MAG: nucleotidyltransferase domain-containing protein [Pseudomonadota bacterium]|nr:nucleotidyltransferase domain-containing protein [Pseudomonadota bacterium]